jgi:alpha-galactosidase/6-phospho-beta-glucosidase family protein
LLLAHANNAPQVFILNVVNRGTAAWMPEGSIIETPALVGGHS